MKSNTQKVEREYWYCPQCQESGKQSMKCKTAWNETYYSCPVCGGRRQVIKAEDKK